MWITRPHTLCCDWTKQPKQSPRTTNQVREGPTSPRSAWSVVTSKESPGRELTTIFVEYLLQVVSYEKQTQAQQRRDEHPNTYQPH
ncbi:hypothetical protein GW17_00019524 [Ensete ventricosum]|nr:hypothetical protein GW17_00019524 [Ensete ventricosum]